MNHKQAANILVSAYFAQTERIGGTPEAILKGSGNVQDVFQNLGQERDKGKAKFILNELINVMMQPSSEKVHLNSVEQGVKNNVRIQVNLTHGLGLKVKNKRQIEILDLINEDSLDPWHFGALLARMIGEKRKEYKVKKNKLNNFLLATIKG